MLFSAAIDHTNAPWLSTLESRYLHDDHDDDDDDDGDDGDDGEDDDDGGGHDGNDQIYDCNDDQWSC